MVFLFALMALLLSNPLLSNSTIVEARYDKNSDKLIVQAELSNACPQTTATFKLIEKGDNHKYRYQFSPLNPKNTFCFKNLRKTFSFDINDVDSRPAEIIISTKGKYSGTFSLQINESDFVSVPIESFQVNSMEQELKAQVFIQGSVNSERFFLLPKEHSCVTDGTTTRCQFEIKDREFTKFRKEAPTLKTLTFDLSEMPRPISLVFQTTSRKRLSVTLPRAK